jgi:hypothetical protein
VVSYLLGEAAGEAVAPPPLGIGELTVGELGCVVGLALLNQFHFVKPKNKKTKTSRAMSAAAMPAPAPAVSLVSTTSEPAGLQYRRTL